MRTKYQIWISRLSNWSTNLTITFGIIICLISLLGWCSRISWRFDTFSHFRLQYGVMVGVMALLALMRRRVRWGSLLTLFALLNLSLVAWLWLPETEAAVPSPATVLTLVSVNVNFQNESPQLVGPLLQRLNPDVIALQELTPSGLARIEPALKNYPYRVTDLRTDPFGSGIFSKFRIISSKQNPLNLEPPSALSAMIQPGKRPIEIIDMHPMVPVRPIAGDIYDKVIEGVSNMVRSFDGSIVMLGDLNSTPFSKFFTRLLAGTGLRDSERGFGLQPTWPNWCWAVRLPIDHCLVSHDCRVVERRVLADNVGSDHYALLVKVMVSDRTR